jgi:hypothetical protein
MSSTTTSSEKTYAHFPDLQAARRRARDAEIKAFEAFHATEETRLAAVKAAETIYRAALAAADAAAKETQVAYKTAAAAARTAEKTLDKARIEAGGRRPVRYQVSDDIGQSALDKMIADRTYSTVLPSARYPHLSTEFLARMHAEGVQLGSNKNVCDTYVWHNLKEIKNGDILYMVTSSDKRTWVPSKIYKGTVRSGPVHSLDTIYYTRYRYEDSPTKTLKMTWEVSWRLLGDYDETYKDCFIDMTTGSSVVKIKKALPQPVPTPAPSGPLPPATEE